MKNMKRLIAVMLMLTVALGLIACAGNQNGNDDGSKPASTPTTAPTTKGTEPSGTTAPTGTTGTTAPSGTTGTTDPIAPTTAPAPAYTHAVLVLDQDGNPVAGVAVQLCDDGTCYSPALTDENGLATFNKPGITGAKARIFFANSDPTHVYGKTEYVIDVMDGMDADGYLKFNDATQITLTVTLETV